MLREHFVSGAEFEVHPLERLRDYFAFEGGLSVVLKFLPNFVVRVHFQHHFEKNVEVSNAAPRVNSELGRVLEVILRQRRS